ncbi:glycosyltransferase [Flagellimonas olearia]|uniref:Glycosyltransferase n=1 Tax=Flagellimonas olearia TaxID=552546 RepID=A0A6I1DWC2_9FLAO|nr:glycosyltransferase [Allomuricauda olearia]KAB7528669.1 glycosyltransferase [Allomuricauda olearia]
MGRTSDIVVLIPHYNNFQGLLNSIKSIQENILIDVLIVDDGSTTNHIDENLLVLSKPDFVELDFIYLEQNKGIEHVLNLGLDKIKANTKYNYVARLDCGDLSQPNRLQIQKDYLDSNEEVGIVGSFVKFFDTDGNYVYNLEMPIDHGKIMRLMYVNAMFIHPTIMFKSKVLTKVGHYPTNYPAAEDYAFFFEILQHFKGGNIDEYLVHCELNPFGISMSRRKTQVRSRLRLILRYFKLGIYPIYGLIRNSIIYILPNSFILFLKKI